MKNSFFKIFFSFIVLLVPFIVLAGTGHNLSGWAWSDNIGWISFNSTNCDTDNNGIGNGFVDSGICGGDNSTTAVVDYGVNKRGDGYLVGHAWANPADDTGVVSAPASPASPTVTKVSFNTYGTHTWIVPEGVTSINVKLWGAGGGNDGGGGGFTSGTVAVTAGETLTASVGQGGVIGGGSGAACTGTGGGRTSLIKRLSTGFGGGGAREILIAGGGGGGACYNGLNGGAGGGLAGQDGTTNEDHQGRGGTQTAGGAGGSGNGGAGSAGSLLQGGTGGGTATCGTGAGVVAGSFGGGGGAVSNNSYSCAGGGGGYYGGGGGGTAMSSGSSAPYGAGGGGSGFISNNSVITNGVTIAGNYTTPANASDADRNGAGRGATTGDGNSADGAVVISYTTFSSSAPSSSNNDFSVPGTYSWIVPAGVTSVQLEMIGAGGKGGDGNWSFVNGGAGPGGGGGGGSGAYGTKTLTVSPEQTYQITVGASGSATIFSGNGVSLTVGSGGNGGVGSAGVGGVAGSPGVASGSFTVSSSGSAGSPGVAGGYTYDCGGGFSYGGDGGAGASNAHGGTGGTGGVDKCRKTTPAGDGGAGGLGAGGGGASGWLGGDYGGPNSGGSGGNGKVSLSYQATGGGGTASTVKTNNIGWIKFGGLAPNSLPIADGSQRDNAKMDSSGNLTGWAKALSANPATGWDGFVSLSGDGYGVTLTNTAIPFITASAEKGLANMFAWIPKFFNTAYASSPSQRFAWGSDVVGWVDFSGVIVGSSLTPAVTISANPTSGQVGVVNPGLTWSATNNPTSCTASGDWSGEKPVSGDNVSQGVLSISKTYTYTIACSNANGAGTPASATVTAGTPICGPGNGSTPQEFEPTGALACTYGGHNADSPPDTNKLWKWKCGTNVCSAPPYGCTIVGDDNYDANGPSNNLGCAGAVSCPEGQTGTPDTICCDGTANPPQYYDGISACIGENDICPSGTSGTPVTGCVRKKPNFQED